MKGVFVLSNPWHGFEADLIREQKRQGRLEYTQKFKVKQREDACVDAALQDEIDYCKSRTLRESNAYYETLHMQAVRNDTIIHAWEKSPIKEAAPICRSSREREEFDILSLLSINDQRKFEKWLKNS